MRKMFPALWLSALALSIILCFQAYGQGKNAPVTAIQMARQKAALEQNPLLASWSGKYGGVPPFNLVKVSHFKPALEKAMAQNLAQIQNIADSKAFPDFENTVLALEQSGKTLTQVRAVFDLWCASLNTPQIAQLEEEMLPKLAALKDRIYQNNHLFKRIEMVSRTAKNLTKEQQRLVAHYLLNFELAGAKLDAATKAQVSDVNQELATLYANFNKNLLADETEKYVHILSAAELEGLPQATRDAAAAEAQTRKLPGWVVANTRSSVEPFLTMSSNRPLREKVLHMFSHRGDNADKNDNNELITSILRLRAAKARLMGYPSFAHWRLANTMAGKPEMAMQLMDSAWAPALRKVQTEVADMQQLADAEKTGIRIEPWDYRYYAEKVRKMRYDLDVNEVKPYLQLDKLQEGMFWVAGELFGLTFTRVKDVPVFHPDVQVWKVENTASGSLAGLWYFDPYARPGKRSGAWMTAYREQHRMGGKNVPTLVSNNSNFVKGKPGEAVLISWDDAETLFHEFGHAMHGLCSNATYPSLSGTNVPQDYAEFPSQVVERWLSTPQVLQKYALHYQTGKPIPQMLVDRIRNAAHFNQGFQMVEATASAMVDMKLHLFGDSNLSIEPDAFERNTLKIMQMPPEILMRHRLPQFGHIFGSEAYAACYYSYLWSDVLSDDAWEAFTEAGGAFDKTVAKRLYDNVFSVGNTVDPQEAYTKFRGRPQKTNALMRARGLGK